MFLNVCFFLFSEEIQNVKKAWNRFRAIVLFLKEKYSQFERELRISESRGPLARTGVPTVVGLAIALIILAFLLCFMFRLFNRSR